MTKYYVDANNQNTSTKIFKVHKDGCFHLSESSQTEYIGEFDNFLDAIVEADKYYHSVDGCKDCCPHYHKA